MIQQWQDGCNERYNDILHDGDSVFVWTNVHWVVDLSTEIDEPLYSVGICSSSCSCTSTQPLTRLCTIAYLHTQTLSLSLSHTHSLFLSPLSQKNPIDKAPGEKALLEWSILSSHLSISPTRTCGKEETEREREKRRREERRGEGRGGRPASRALFFFQRKKENKKEDYCKINPPPSPPSRPDSISSSIDRTRTCITLSTV
jgi:hypothetical protein